MIRKIAIILVMLGFVAGCVGDEITAIKTTTETLPMPTETATAQLTLDIDPYNIPTSIITPTLSATPSYFVRDGTPIPGSGEVITRDNVSQLAEMAILGHGRIDLVEFANDNQLMIVQTPIAIYAYLVGTLDEQWRIYIPAGVSAMNISTNQRWLAYSTYDGTIHIILTEDGKEIKQWNMTETWAVLLGFSSDDLMIVTADYENYTRVWDISTMELIMEHQFENEIAEVFFTRLNSWVATKVWNYEYGYEYFFLDLINLQLSEQSVHPETMLAFLPNSNFYAGDDQLVEIGSFDKLTDLVDVPEHLLDWWGSLSADISDDGSLLAIGLLSTGVGIWRVSDGTLVGIFEPEDQAYISSGKMNAPIQGSGPGNHKINSVDISVDNRMVVATNGFGEIYLWEIESGNLITKIEGIGRYSEISPNMDFLVSYTYDSLALYSIPTGRLTSAIPGMWGGAELFFSPDSTRLANGSRLWNIDTGVLEYTPFGESIIGFSLNGLTYFTISPHWTVHQRSMVDLEMNEQVKLDLWGIDGEYLEYMGRWGISPDNSIIYGSAYGAPLISWYIEDGNLASLKRYIYEPSYGYPSNASNYAIYNATKNVIEVHKVSDRDSEIFYSIPFKDSLPNEIIISLETEKVIVVSDPFLYIFDIITGNQIFFGEIPHEYDWYQTDEVNISVDGKLLAVLGANMINFYDLENLTFLVSIKVSNYSVAAAFSPDGTLFATRMSDGTVRLWGIPND